MTTPTTAALAPADTAAVAAVSDVHGQALIDHDADAFMATCTDDIIFLPPNEEPAVGQEACHAWLGGFPRFTRFRVHVEEVEGRGDLAVSRGHAKGTMEDGTEAMFKFMAVFRKQADGQWKMARDMWSLNTPG
jgi:ketosteroid isomerase-like protein